MYITCTNRPDLFKNLNSLNLQNRESSMENQQRYQTVKIQLKIVYIKCIDCPDLLRNLVSLKVQSS